MPIKKCVTVKNGIKAKFGACEEKQGKWAKFEVSPHV